MYGQDCAEYHFHSLVSEELRGGGAHYMDPKGQRAAVTSMHEQAADCVWKHTLEMIKSRVEQGVE